MKNQNELRIQLERLKRHYETVIHTNDHISLLDLSNTLRIWTELKEQIDINEFPLISAPLFKTGSPNKFTKKLFKGTDSFWISFPDGVVTFANNGALFGAPQRNSNLTSIGGKIRSDNSKLIVWQVSVCNYSVENEGMHDQRIHETEITKVKYSYWLGSEAVRIYSEEQNELITIPRDIIIKRVANILDGSHASTENYNDKENRFDKYIKYLMEVNCGGLSMPYLVTLKIAQDILSQMPKILKII